MGCNSSLRLIKNKHHNKVVDFPVVDFPHLTRLKLLNHQNTQTIILKFTNNKLTISNSSP